MRSSSRVAWRVMVFSAIGPSKLMSRVGIFLLVRHQVAADDFLVAQDHVALDQVLEFADVARPVMLLQRRHQVSRKGAGAAVVFAVVVLQEIGDQVRNVAFALAQRRHLQIDDVDAIEQVLTESSAFDFRFQHPVGGADYAHFNFLVFLGADPAELAVLQQLQQLGLQTQVEFGDFVEKQRAAMGQFHAPRLRSVGAGESAFFVSEEFAFQQRARNRGTVDFDKGTASATERGRGSCGR